MGANFDMANSHFDWTNPPLPKTAMRVRYEQEIVYEAFVDRRSSRTSANVTVRLDAHGLTVTHNGRLYVEELPIFAWAPRPHWQFTLGASTHGLGRFFRVDNLRIRSGDLLQSGAVPVGDRDQRPGAYDPSRRDSPTSSGARVGRLAHRGARAGTRA